MDLEPVRQYLQLPPRTSAAEVMLDAVVSGLPGALYILTTVMELRVNRRSRRSLVEVLQEYQKVKKARWYGIMVEHVWSMYRLFLAESYVSDQRML